MDTERPEPSALATKQIVEACDNIAGYVSMLEDQTNASAVDLDPSWLAKHYADVRRAADEIGVISKRIGKLKELLATTIIPETFDARGVQTVTLSTGERVTTTAGVRASIVEGMKGAAFEWLKANGLEDLITETVNSNTLSSVMKDRLESGDIPPDDIFQTYIYRNTSLTKTK